MASGAGPLRLTAGLTRVHPCPHAPALVIIVLQKPSGHQQLSLSLKEVLCRGEGIDQEGREGGTSQQALLVSVTVQSSLVQSTSLLISWAAGYHTLMMGQQISD